MPASAAKWQSLLDQMNSASNFYRPKEGRSRLRLVQMPEMVPDEEGIFQFYAEVQSTFRGKTKSRFLVPALVLDGPGARPEMATKITPVVLPKAVIKGILGLLAEGYDLFSDEGFGITVARTGQGLDTDYNVLPSKNPVALPEGLELPEKTFTEMAEDFEKWANRPGAGGSSADDEEQEMDEEPAPAPRGKRRPGRGTQRQSGDW